MIDPVVRPATGVDADELAALERSARSALLDQRGGVRWLDEHPVRGSDWPDVIGRTPVFVADLDGVPVGYLVLRLGDDVAVVDEVYVAPEAREVGFGDELLAAALTVAREAGAVLFEATALPGDRDTKNLYERAGITARSITVSTRLDGR